MIVAAAEQHAQQTRDGLHPVQLDARSQREDVGVPGIEELAAGLNYVHEELAR